MSEIFKITENGKQPEKAAVEAAGLSTPSKVGAAPTAAVPPSPPLRTAGTVSSSPAPSPSLASRIAVPARPVQDSLSARVSSMLGYSAGAPPKGIVDGNSDDLHTGFFHFMLYGNPSSFKTSTAARFMGPEKTRIIVTRRAEQMIPLAGMGYKFKVATDAESLRYLLLYPEKVWPEWAALPDRTLLIDDVTEGVNMLVDDHKYYIVERGADAGQMKEIKDPRQAYKKAGDEMHDLFKINLGKKQHTGLIAVERGYEVDGTIDYRIEPDIPNKVAKLFATELEFVFYMEEGDNGKMLTKSKVVTRMSGEKNKSTGQPDTWREITFAKAKLPINMLALNVLANAEEKDLSKVWSKIKGAMQGEAPAKVAAPTVRR